MWYYTLYSICADVFTRRILLSRIDMGKFIEKTAQTVFAWCVNAIAAGEESIVLLLLYTENGSQLTGGALDPSLDLYYNNEC